MPQKSVLNVYHALFASHMRYACQVWGLCDNFRTHRIQVLQNIACRLMTFNGPRTSATPLYRELEILKFFDQVKVQNTLFVHSHLNSQLPQDTLNSLSFTKLNHRYGTRGNRMGLLELGNVNTTRFGLNSLMRVASNQWNSLQRTFPNTELSSYSMSKFKKLVIKHYLSNYT